MKNLTWFGSSLVIATCVNTNPELVWRLKNHIWRNHVSTRIFTDFRGFQFNINWLYVRCCWKCKECNYDFKDRRKQKKHQWSNHVWKRISTGFKLFKWFSGSTGLIGSTSGFLEGLLDAVADLRRHWLKSCYWSDCLWWWIIMNLQRKNTLRSTHDIAITTVQ